MHAVNVDNLPLANILLENKANSNDEDNKGFTAIALYCINKGKIRG